MDFVRFIMKTPSFFGNTGEADVLLLRMRSRRECINFVMEYENYTFGEALKHLADRAGGAASED